MSKSRNLRRCLLWHIYAVPMLLCPPVLAMDFVTIGEPGNIADQVYGCGKVAYVFEIGKYEITNQEYAVFLNAVARTADPFNLYSPSMSTGLFGGISRAVINNEYSYRAERDWEKRPVVYISWYDLARMANWYHYGNPDEGTSQLGTTEGTDTEGAYDTRNFPQGFGDEMNYKKLPNNRNPKALYWIPDDDEWYKAAYYDPTRWGARKYWDYAMRCCDLINNSPPPGDARSANYYNGTFSVGKPYFLTEVGSYVKASSYFGTFDQCGNVWEWIENWKTMWMFPDKKGRITRGGSATYTEIGLHGMNQDPLNPAHEAFVFGGRLARAYKDNSGKIIYSRVPFRFSGYLQKLRFHKKAMAIGALVGCAAALGLLAIVWGVKRLFGRHCRPE